MERKYSNSSIYRRQDGRWVAAVCSRDPVTDKFVRQYRYGKTKQEALQKKMELLAKSEKLPVTFGLTASRSYAAPVIRCKPHAVATGYTTTA
jgi:hypothetical protein